MGSRQDWACRRVGAVAFRDFHTYWKHMGNMAFGDLRVLHEGVVY
jgi:hypothetical protein